MSQDIPETFLCQQYYAGSTTWGLMKRKKGIYVGIHEREEVVDDRKKFLRKIVSNGFLNKDNSPNPEATSCLPADLESPSQEQIKK